MHLVLSAAVYAVSGQYLQELALLASKYGELELGQDQVAAVAVLRLGERGHTHQ